MILEVNVIKIQEKWSQGIIEIGVFKDDFKACEKLVDAFLDRLYGFNEGKVLFKPTKASKVHFRITKEGAKSYFIGGNVNFPEDIGFALHPWINVRFENVSVICEKNRALAMGYYFFADLTGGETKVEYTFGYIEDKKGNLKIDVHHSSIPYTL